MFRYIVFSVLTAESIFFSNGCQSIPGSDEIQSVEVGGEYGRDNRNM